MDFKPMTAKSMLHDLASLYQKRDGHMRTCRHYPSDECNRKECALYGCTKAHGILNSLVEQT